LIPIGDLMPKPTGRTTWVTLSHKMIENLAADPTRRTEYADEGSPGPPVLRLMITPLGSRSWILRYRRPNGAVVKTTLGGYKPAASATRPALGMRLSLAEARSWAGELQARHQAGEDIFLTERRRSQPAPAGTYTFGAAVLDYVRLKAALKNRDGGEQPARHLGLVIATGAALEGRPYALWRDIPLAEITGRMIVDHLAAVESQTMGDRRYSALNAMFRWLVRERLEPIQNPMPAREKKKSRRDRVLSDVEIKKLWSSTAKLGPRSRDAVRVLLLTAQRREQIEALRWDQLDGKITLIHFTGDDMKEGLRHIMPVSKQVKAIIEGARRYRTGDFIFGNGRRPLNLRTAADKLRVAVGPGWVLHDLRRTVRTCMTGDLGIEPHVAERVLAHKVSGIAAVYDVGSYRPQMKAALQKWADEVDRIVRKRSLL
jgi:integrase